MNKELEALEKLLSFAFVMSENMVGLTKGNYDEQEFIKKTYEYLHKYNVDLNSKLELKNALQRLEAIDNSNPSEALEDLEVLEDCANVCGDYSHTVESIRQALLELKAIKETNPSKALKELNEIIEYITEDKKVKYKATILFDCDIIKDALLQAQKDKAEIEKLKRENTILHAELATFEKLMFKKNKGE